MKNINQLIVLLGLALVTSISHASIITYNITGARLGSVESSSSYGSSEADSSWQMSADTVSMEMSFLLDSAKYFDYGPDEFASYSTQDASTYPVWLTSHASASGDILNFTQVTHGAGLSMYDAVKGPWSAVPLIALYAENTWETKEYFGNGALKSIATHWQVNQIYADVSVLNLALFDGKEIATRADGILGSYIYMHYQTSTLNYNELGDWISSNNTDVFAGSVIDSIDVLIDGKPINVPEPAPILLLCLGLCMLLHRQYLMRT